MQVNEIHEKIVCYLPINGIDFSYLAHSVNPFQNFDSSGLFLYLATTLQTNISIFFSSSLVSDTELKAEPV